MTNEEEDERPALEQLEELMGEMGEEDNFLFVAQSDADGDTAVYKAFSTGDYDTVVNSAIVALTLAGKDIIASQGGDPNAPGMDAKAFFHGLQVMSKTAERWAASIKAEQEAGQEGPKHVKETVEDSAGSADTSNPPRTANDGSSIH